MTLGLRARRVVFGLALVAVCATCGYFLRTGAPTTPLIKFLPDELIEEEERDLMRDFRTSFVPRDARYAEVADYLGQQEQKVSRKVKRDRQSAEIGDGNNETVPHPSMGKSGGTMSGRGPLDVEGDLRSIPEVEDAEIALGPIRNLETLDLEPPGIRALWTDQNDAQKIRKTQADIMTQYMDWTADPCDDFYQYSCGNWAQVNPIPPDKAGFDTFEMLRENLDTVLREILTVKNFECCNEYPGPNLDLGNDIVFDQTSTTEFPKATIENSSESDVNVDLVDFETTIALNSLIDTTRNKRSTSSHEDSTLCKMINNDRMDPIKVEKQLEQDDVHVIGDNITRDIVNNSNSIEEVENSPGKLEISISSNKEHHNDDIRRVSKRNIPLSKEDDIEEEAKRKEEQDPANEDATMKVKFLFESCMNHDILRKRGNQPLLDLLGMFGGWPILDPGWDASNFDWLEMMAKLRLYNNDILISEWVGPDIMNSDEFVIQLDQTTLGLPTRDYFLQSSNKAYLDGYKEFIVKIATLLGSHLEHAQQEAHEIILFETRLAGIVSSPEQRRNVSLLYQRMSVRELTSLVPRVDWQKYLSIVLNRPTGLNETVVMFALKYAQNLVTLISETEPKTLANYLLWRFIRHRANNLDDRFQEAKQQFYYVLFGREQAPLRWKNCVTQVNSNMGMAMGSMFVQKYFDENSKNDTLTMTREIQQSFIQMLNYTTWIDDETKSLAMEKVETMTLRIGYPDFILDKTALNDRYKDLKIHPNKYFENTLNILQHQNKFEQSRLGQSVNKTVWNTAPAVVNAYYSRNTNQIMFPAGILQPPFYHRHFPKSLNYGGIGVVIGHEITHGFDDKGRLFDNSGNLHKWWKSLAIEAFHKRAQCLIDQYSNYTVSEVSMEIDGFNTQGENIADNGGIKQAFTAYHRWLAENPKNDETLPGLNLTNTQLFFLNFAQIWCGAMRPEALKNKLKTAVHSPGKFRVIGTLSNFDEFAKEFNCPAGSHMNPVTKCRVW